MGNSNCCGADHSKTTQLHQRKHKRYIKKIKSINKKSLTTAIHSSSSINITPQPASSTPQKGQCSLKSYHLKSDNLKSNNLLIIEDLIEDEKNIDMQRVDRLSLIEIDNAAEIRRIVTRQYMDADTDADAETAELELDDIGDDEFEYESDISELSPAGKQQNESKKSNLTPTTMVLWGNNELRNIENEMQQQLQHLTTSTYKEEEAESSLFRFKSLDKWDEDHVKTEQFAMREQMVHLIQTNLNTQRNALSI